MKKLSVLFAALITMMMLNTDASAQKIEKFLSTLKVGDWVELEGLPQRDLSVIVDEIEVVRGEMEDDDYEIAGLINRVSLKERTIYMVNLPIKLAKDAEYDEDGGSIKSFSDIKAGLYVEVEGTYLRDGIFMGDEIAVEDFKEDEKHMVDWTGKVEAIDPQGKTITVFGHVLTFTEQTKFKSYN